MSKNINFFKYTGIHIPREYKFTVVPEPGVLKLSHFLNENFVYIMRQLKEEPKFHGKQWQYFQIISNALSITNRRKKSAIGFGVGVEPVVAFLAKLGFRVTATDYLDGDYSQDWLGTGQMLSNPKDLNDREICDANTFQSNVNFLNLDMNQVDVKKLGRFDFVWSNCALGHIGGYQHGLNFINRSLPLLKKGGIAVHTTELDLTGKKRFDSPGLSLYQEKDLRLLMKEIQVSSKYHIPNHNFQLGGSDLESLIDEPPYGLPHLQLQVFDRTVIPFSLVVMRN